MRCQRKKNWNNALIAIKSMNIAFQNYKFKFKFSVHSHTSDWHCSIDFDLFIILLNINYVWKIEMPIEIVRSSFHSIGLLCSIFSLKFNSIHGSRSRSNNRIMRKPSFLLRISVVCNPSLYFFYFWKNWFNSMNRIMMEK